MKIFLVRLLLFGEVQHLIFTSSVIAQRKTVYVEIFPDYESFDSTKLQCFKRVLYHEAVLSCIL